MSSGSATFCSPYHQGFVRVAAGVPLLSVTDPAANVPPILELMTQAHERGAACLVLPELALSGYSADDLLHQDALLDACDQALAHVMAHSKGLRPLMAVGLPLRVEHGLFNVAAVIHDGSLLAFVPKTWLPNYREFYERRHFSSGGDARCKQVTWRGRAVPFGSDLLFHCPEIRGLSIHIEICEDLWVPIPPSTWGALAGATVLLNLSASNVTVGKAGYRQLLCEAHSARCLSAYAYAASGFGESTTDLAWDGQALICENGATLASAERFAGRSTLTVADVDLDRLRQERMRMTSWRDQAASEQGRLAHFRDVSFHLQVPTLRTLERHVPRFPYVPADAATRDARCSEIFSIQVQGLQRRMAHTSGKHLVIGVSGGLDSTLALLVAAETVDRLQLPRTRILGFTMPGFATSEVTKAQAHELMRALGTSAEEIDIRPSCRQMLADVNHPFSRGEEVYDITFENVQAGERTSHLFRLANQRGGFVVGTGDLSELALGWCTYGVGDQMAHYNVNASIPKTLVRYLIAWAAHTGRFGEATSRVLRRIVEATISPELIPAKAGKAQATEESVGPYDLQDFTLYYLTRFGYRPRKIAFLAWHAWHDPRKGDWPDLVPAHRRHAYDLDTIVHWQKVFLDRFVRRSQYKRSAMPNGPKVGSGGSLSPRGDWRAPSDASATAWLHSLEHEPDFEQDPD